jgi:DNA-binding transcriptional ArsR family regulator
MTNQLDATFAALADPTRRAILSRLQRGEATVLELAEPFAMSLPAISKHLKVLERAGLIARGRDAQRRPCRLRPAPLKAATDWTGDFRRFWEDSFDALDEHLDRIKRTPHPPSLTSGRAATKETRHGRKKRH